MLFSAFVLDDDGAQIRSWQFNFDKLSLNDLTEDIETLRNALEDSEDDEE